MQHNYRITKLACYTVSMTMSVVGNISPILFLTFRSQYGISYSLLGLLVFINFFTQLTVDTVFSFFSHKFDIHKTVKFTPVLGAIGLVVYAVWPFIFPDSVYAGLVLGTVIFSAASGLGEVLISPVVAAIPAENPEREMSKLHSVYAWGVVGVILFSTAFLLVFKQENWQWLALVFVLIPLTSAILFSKAQLPPLETPERVSGAVGLMKNKGLWLCFAAIFFGGAVECTMAQWASGYIERALEIPKVFGDIFGVALFSLTLGLGRTLYSKFGKNIEKVLLAGAIGSVVCYFTPAVSNIAVIGLVACALTGFCSSMLWPGTLVVASDRFPMGGVFIYALMAAGGDFGAAIGPQLVGIITDTVSASPAASAFAQDLGITAEQLGMKMGILAGMLFAVVAVVIYLVILRGKKKRESLEHPQK